MNPAGSSFILVAPHLGIACIAIPKCGSTTIRRWWVELVEGRPLPCRAAEVHRYCREHHALSRFDPEAAPRILSQCFTLLVSRDPVQRLASAFVSKFVGLGALSPTCWPVVRHVQSGAASGPRAQSPAAAWASPRPVNPEADFRAGISFRAFAEYVCSTPDHELNPHWRPQAWFAQGLRVDLIARLPDLDAALRALAARARRSAPPVAPPQSGGGGGRPLTPPSAPARATQTSPPGGSVGAACDPRPPLCTTSPCAPWWRPAISPISTRTRARGHTRAPGPPSPRCGEGWGGS